jgi:hypothetical protein
MVKTKKCAFVLNYAVKQDSAHNNHAEIHTIKSIAPGSVACSSTSSRNPSYCTSDPACMMMSLVYVEVLTFPLEDMGGPTVSISGAFYKQI